MFFPYLSFPYYRNLTGKYSLQQPYIQFSRLSGKRGFLEKEGLQLLQSNCQLTFRFPCCPSNKKFKPNLILRYLNNNYGNLYSKQIANIKLRNWQPQNFVKELKATRMGLNILFNKSLKIFYL